MVSFEEPPLRWAKAPHAPSALYPPVWPRVYDPNAVFALLLERRGEDAEVETECATYVKDWRLPGSAPNWLQN